ncbi:ester cyclase [Amycolatopsis sp.]|uniref:ester cyclase n=1 Tax=Amycolatopsis sp. TaxID=37632 RepID=UPI002B5E8CCF|nr:ester cyclase [Amycolatopsis sp.]HVV11718.1 ester cyclase [Amycolatopsis sp.]
MSTGSGSSSSGCTRRARAKDILFRHRASRPRWTMHGTQTGDFLGAAPTGRRVSLRGNVFFGFRQDRVAGIRPVIDLAGLRAQLTTGR